MKPFQFGIIFFVAAAVAALVWVGISGVFREGPATTPNANLQSPTAGKATNVSLQTDADGCLVIDLRQTPATSHDPAKRVYTWVIDHPADAACIRQLNPTIPEPVVESRSEKIRGTNSWKFELLY